MTPVAAFSTALHPAFLDGDPAAHLKETEAGNVGLVRDAYAALARGDAAAFAGLLTDDAELEIVGPPDLPFAGQWKGRWPGRSRPFPDAERCSGVATPRRLFPARTRKTSAGRARSCPQRAARARNRRNNRSSWKML